MSETKCVSKEPLSLKPCGNSYISRLESMCLTTLEAMMCSITLHQMHVKEIGLYLAAVNSPISLLNIDGTLAEFHKRQSTGLNGAFKKNWLPF